MQLTKDVSACSAPGTSLPPTEIHVWQIRLSRNQQQIPTICSSLSPDEIERAHRFYFKRDQYTFIVSRAATRKILGAYLHAPPGELLFSYGAKGKPELAGGYNRAGIKFNVSHSGGFALLAVARGLCLGVDIEIVNEEFAREGIAEEFFSPNEIVALRTTALDARVQTFFSLWTRKEAYIKALGTGLSVPLNSFDVSSQLGARPDELGTRVSPNHGKRWTLYDLIAPPGYRAALVAEGRTHLLRQWRWTSGFSASSEGSH